jgi:hypothetical protein
MKIALLVLLTACAAVNAQDSHPAPHPVRNDVAQPGREIVTIRYFRIKKGSFEVFLKTSQEDIWPFFNKMGARVVGMWKVFDADENPGPKRETKDYDEVYLTMRYASVEHWKATRDGAALSGNGPDWERCQKGLALRQSLTISTNVTFMEGAMATNGPFYMPALKENYQLKP